MLGESRMEQKKCEKVIIIIYSDMKAEVLRFWKKKAK